MSISLYIYHIPAIYTLIAGEPLVARPLILNLLTGKVMSKTTMTIPYEYSTGKIHGVRSVLSAQGPSLC